MMKRILFLLLFAATGLPATAQPTRTYEVPKLTDEVRAIRAAAAAWTPSKPLEGSLPASVDNSKLKYFPKVFDQKGGSCAQSSGIRYLFTYEMNRLLDRDAQASDANTFSYFYTWNFLNDGIDQGGFAEQGLNIARQQGAMSLADFPDPSSYFTFKWASGYDRYTRAMQNRVKEIISFEVTSQEGVDLARRYLYDAGDGSAYGGILSYSALATGWSFDSNYSGPSETGYTYMLTKLATDGAHAMTIVGYDDTVEFVKDGQIHKGAFIVVNSYGTWWGDEGRYYLPYYFFLQDRPSQTLSHDVTGCSCTVHSPQVVFRVKVTYDSRNDLAFTMGVADKPYATTPTVTLKSAIAANQGGDHPMQGQYSDDNSIELAFDFTEAVPKYASYTEPKYFLTITRSEIGKARQRRDQRLLGDRLPGCRRPEGVCLRPSATGRVGKGSESLRCRHDRPQDHFGFGRTMARQPLGALHDALCGTHGKRQIRQIRGHELRPGNRPGDDQVSLSGRRHPQS